MLLLCVIIFECNYSSANLPKMLDIFFFCWGKGGASGGTWEDTGMVYWFNFFLNFFFLVKPGICGFILS